MPDHSNSRLPAKAISAEPVQPVHAAEAPALPEPVAQQETPAPENGAKATPQRSTRAKRATEPDGGQEPAPAESAAGA